MCEDERKSNSGKRLSWKNSLSEVGEFRMPMHKYVPEMETLQKSSQQILMRENEITMGLDGSFEKH